MYELVNTSVPNGLIAGTHGFATVAMTKGMPDSLRTRLENLCAYPHRTSAHDASYYSENPVNWFHLTLPSGEHVLGRTAAAEFDYTGRTNRLSRLLCLSVNEMSRANAPSVIAAEGHWFLENWNSDPKLLSSRSFSPSTALSSSVSHWTDMFGVEGKSFARRFALLLQRNIRSGKGIYFKTSAAKDCDGRLLLGLFFDLISLLPDDEASCVTFATFSACVPNGVVCHLKGLYDKDRAFETASALQPWVDCENGCVRHPELLPEDIPSAAPESISGVATESASASIRPDLRLRREQTSRQDVQRRAADYFNSRAAQAASNQIPLGKILLLVGLGLAVIAGVIWFLAGDDIYRKIKGSSTGDYVNEAQKGDEEIRSWFGQKTRECEEIRKKAVALESSHEIAKLILDVQNRRRELPQSFAAISPGKNDTLFDAQDLFDSLISELKSKESTLKNNEVRQLEAVAERKKKEDEDRIKKAESDRKAKEQIKALTSEQSAEDKKLKELQERTNVALKDLRIDKVIPADIDWVKGFAEEEKRKLTRKESVAIWFLSSGSVKKVLVELTERTVKKVHNQRTVEIVEYETPKVDTGTSPWEIILVVIDGNDQKVFWRWHDWPVKEIFKGGKVDKNLHIAACFGAEEAFNAWSRYSNGQVWFLSDPIDSSVGYGYLSDLSSGEDVIKEWESSCCARFDAKNQEIRDELKNAETSKKKCDQEIANIASDIEKARLMLAKLTSMSSAEKKEKGFGGKTKAQSLTDEIEGIMKPLVEKARTRFDRRAIKQGIDDAESRLAFCRHPGNHDKAKIQAILDKRESDKVRKISSLRGARYKIQVLDAMPQGYKRGWNKIKRQESEED